MAILTLIFAPPKTNAILARFTKGLTVILHYLKRRERQVQIRREPVAALRPREWRKEEATKIERLTIAGPAGRLETLLEWEPSRTPRFAAIVCHPHPLYGGTMHNKVAYRAAKAALAAGALTLRFNFRGAGKSEGVYAEGIGERDDARAALDYLVERFQGFPVAMMGFSFGSTVALYVGAEDERVRVLVGLGLPVASTHFAFLESSRKQKLVVQATEDQYGPREKLQAVYDRLAEPKELRWIEGVDHFFTGKLPELQATIEGFLQRWLAAQK